MQFPFLYTISLAQVIHFVTIVVVLQYILSVNALFDILNSTEWQQLIRNPSVSGKMAEINSILCQIVF